MALSEQQGDDIEDILKKSLRRKFQDYKPELAVMPFHTRLLGKDRLALYSFIHSLNTNFGTAIFEPVAEVIARTYFSVVKLHTTAGEYITENTRFEIQKIIDGLITASSQPDKLKETEIIRKVCQSGVRRKIKCTVVDLYLESKTGEKYLFDIKTAKPNAGGFKEFKTTLLEWVGVTLESEPKAKVNTLIAIPYNPYEPQPYNRWTIRGILDLQYELKVGEEFWDFLGGEGTYKDLLGCFERVGVDLRDEIDQYFARFNK